ncbi:hypothetical protein WG947_04895 [Pontibacter sp. H259]|uniref:hypothetical protein n=1 Tax=Pontibacter sp. H259 TaxID=3133421 RepID=UPI0030C5341E
MKKILFTLALATAGLCTSCELERGTSTEVADANKNERVNPSHVRAYHMPGTAGNSTASLTDNTNQSAGTMQAQGTKSAVDLVYAYYNKNNPSAYYRAQNYKFSATTKMAGSAPDTARVKTENRATTIMPQSTTADAQGRKATTGVASSSVEKKSTLGTKKSATTDTQKKTRLTPDETKKQR